MRSAASRKRKYRLDSSICIGRQVLFKSSKTKTSKNTVRIASKKGKSEKLSEYEKQRIQNIKKNEEMLQKLGLFSKTPKKSHRKEDVMKDADVKDPEWTPEADSEETSSNAPAPKPSVRSGSAKRRRHRREASEGGKMDDSKKNVEDGGDSNLGDEKAVSFRDRLNKITKAVDDDEQDSSIRLKKAHQSTFDRVDPTSNNTLAQLNMIPSRELKNYLKKLRPKNKSMKENLMKSHYDKFRKWLLQLHAGFNVLLYGVGSKKKLVHWFASEWLTEGPILVINGYFPALCVKRVLDCITKQIMLAHTKVFNSMLEQVEYIRKFLPSWAPTVYVLVHNIDGPAIRSEDSQTVLAKLASIPQIRMVATIDHILAPVLWSADHIANFNWLAQHTPTFDMYSNELQYTSSVLGGEKEDRARGISYVLQSLTPNHHEILMVLGKEQTSASPQGIDFHSYLGMCQEGMLVSTEVDMRNHLNEMKDHHLVETRKVDGRELYYIPYDAEIIENKILNA